ncbi:MAG: sugar kinase [Hyphomicrobiales bacterium]
MAFDIAAIGEPLYELNRQPDGRFLQGFGGDTSNVAIAASRLGARTAYVTRLGRDMFGDALLELWAKEGIDASAVARDEDAPTGIYFVSHGEGGHRFAYLRKGSAASRLTARDVPDRLIAEARYLHVSGISQAIGETAAAAVDHAIAIARRAGTAISYDTNYRPKLQSAEKAWATVERTAAHAAILKTSLEDAAALLQLRDPQAIARHFIGIGSKAVIVTLGADGVLVATAARSAVIPGFRVDALDATGAGDAFTGALLAELVRGEELFAACRFANAAAALSTLGYGAIAPLPRRQDVVQFLAERQEAKPS